LGGLSIQTNRTSCDPLAGFRRLYDIGSQWLRNEPPLLGGSSLGASDGDPVRLGRSQGGDRADAVGHASAWTHRAVILLVRPLGNEAFEQQPKPIASLHRNRRSHNVFQRFNY
jgi:hypothetical protein